MHRQLPGESSVLFSIQSYWFLYFTATDFLLFFALTVENLRLRHEQLEQ